MVHVQAELEDLSFAVLQPQDYRRVRSQLDSQWGIHTLSSSPQKKQTASSKPDKPLHPGKAPAKLSAPYSSRSSTAAAQPLGEVFFSFDQLMSLSRDGVDDSALRPAASAVMSTVASPLDQVRADDEGRARESSGCATAVLSPPAAMLRQSEAPAGMPMDNGLIARFRGPTPVKIGDPLLEPWSGGPGCSMWQSEANAVGTCVHQNLLRLPAACVAW